MFKLPYILVKRSEYEWLQRELEQVRSMLAGQLGVAAIERERADAACEELNRRAEQWRQLASNRSMLRRIRRLEAGRAR